MISQLSFLFPVFYTSLKLYFQQNRYGLLEVFRQLFAGSHTFLTLYLYSIPIDVFWKKCDAPQYLLSHNIY